jgi:Protein of unknown function (DUF4058)
MPSPFPGIDPYLEGQGLWPDFHVSFLAELRNALADRLPESYVARIDERMNLVEVPTEEVKLVRPDVAVMRQGPERSASPRPRGTLTLEPVTIPLKFLEEFREVYIEILHGLDRRLVAVVELLSPSNKAGNGRRDYLAKRNGLMQQEVHLVELDFLIAGHRLPMEQPLPAGDFFALVARGDRRPDCAVYAWTVRDPLPTIPIPLLLPDPDVLVDLAPLFASVYERARYARSIDYNAPLTLPLKPEDRAWAEELARTSRR